MKRDSRIWALVHGCTGKHYLVGNAHTFPGRITVYCARDKKYATVSRHEMTRLSPMAHAWIDGFLIGSEPSPPRHVKPTSSTFKRWSRAAEFYRAHGYLPDKVAA